MALKDEQTAFGGKTAVFCLKIYKKYYLRVIIYYKRTFYIESD